ncbi:MAG: carbohydrate ABC transporter permease [Meiothermus sp.]|nr:carbohydrate ABC transporter permease [Meiothermus sp.]
MSRKFWLLIAAYAALTLALSAELIPVVWMLATSFKQDGQFFTDPPQWIPTNPTLEHYRSLFAELQFGRFLLNSVVVAALTTFGAVVLGALGAYAIARIRVGERTFMPLLFVQRMAPAAAIVIPIFLMAAGLGITNTVWGVALAHLSFSLPTAVWLMIGFFRELPDSIEEAALIDGCSRPQALWKVVLPLTAPGLAATAILTAINSWNEFFFALILTNTPASQTLPVALSNLVVPILEIKWGAMAAGGVITVLPVFLFALLVQRHLVSGLTGGAVKG